MPIKKVDGYKIKRSKGGWYPKEYPSKAAAEKRVAQMEQFKHMRGSSGGKKLISNKW